MLYTGKTLEELRSLYDTYKEVYYGSIEDDEIEQISDEEFDELEAYLEENDTEFEPYVGADEDYDRHNKASHWYPMLSLSKVHCKDTLTSENVTEIVRKTSSFATSMTFAELSWKLDGFGISTKYKNRQFIQAITRGNKTVGADITAKFGKLFPKEILFDGEIELRWEAMIDKDTFSTKYSGEFRHPRNVVVGIKNNIDLDDSRIGDVTVKCVDAIRPDGTLISLNELLVNGIDTVPFKIVSNFQQISEVYETYLGIRSEFKYPTDGCVLAFNTERRVHDGRYPSTSVALKFPAPTFRTVVTKVTDTLKRTSNIIPKIHFQPVEVDGRKIKQCAGYNYAYIVENRIAEGAEIEISISGDIIPCCKRVLKPSEKEIVLPGTAWSGVHRVDENASTGKLVFEHVMHQLNFDGFGPATFSYLFNKIKNDWTDIFVLKEEDVIELGPTQSKKIIEQIQAIKSIKLRKLIIMLSVTGCGSKTAKQIANSFSGIKYDFSGLQKNVVKYFLEGDGLSRLNSTIETLNSYGIEVEYEVEHKPVLNSVKYVLTGSPKQFGFKTKNEFKATLPENWVEVGKIKESDLLITDDMSSTSSKMKEAKSLNIRITTYDNI